MSEVLPPLFLDCPACNNTGCWQCTGSRVRDAIQRAQGGMRDELEDLMSAFIREHCPDIPRHQLDEGRRLLSLAIAWGIDHARKPAVTESLAVIPRRMELLELR